MNIAHVIEIFLIKLIERFARKGERNRRRVEHKEASGLKEQGGK